jgi:membrane protein YdbS with pleckstrin-like domain
MFDALKALAAELLRVPTDPPHLPEGQGRGTVFRAAPQFLTYQLVVGFIPIAVIFVIATGLVIGGAVTGALPAWAVVLISVAVDGSLAVWTFFTYFGLRLEYELRYYALGDRTLRIREGIFQVREFTITLSNIQNVSIDQGPIEQALGIANVVVETAGGSSAPQAQKHGGAAGHRGVLAGLSNANEVRELLRQAMGKAAHHTGLGHAEEESDVLATPALREVLTEAKALAEALVVRETGRLPR